MGPEAMSEQKDLREEFKPTAEEYRRISAILKWPIYIGFAFWALFFVPKLKVYAFPGFAFCLVGALIISLFWLPKLICPGCGGNMDQQYQKLGTFCPECGEATVKKGWLLPKCTACGKSLARGRGGRNFKIHYCTWCGARVDNEGV